MAAGGISLTQLLRPHWKLLAVAFIAMVVQSAADLLEPWPLKVIFDYVLGAKPMPEWLAEWMPADGQALAVLRMAAAAVIVIALVSAISSYTEKYLATTVAKRVGYDLRHMLYHHVQRLSLSFYEQRQTGDMVVRLTSDIDATEDLISSAALGIVLNVLTLAGMMTVMFYLDWRFSLIGLSVAPFLFVVVYRFTRRIKKAARAVKQKESELASVVQESISSVRVVKAFAREDFEERRLDKQSQESVALSLRARSIKARLPPLVDVIVAIGTCLVLWFGVRLVLDGRLTSGALLVFILYLGKMYKPMKDLSKMADTLSKAAVGFDRLEPGHHRRGHPLDRGHVVGPLASREVVGARRGRLGHPRVEPVLVDRAPSGGIDVGHPERRGQGLGRSARRRSRSRSRRSGTRRRHPRHRSRPARARARDRPGWRRRPRRRARRGPRRPGPRHARARAPRPRRPAAPRRP